MQALGARRRERPEAAAGDTEHGRPARAAACRAASAVPSPPTAMTMSQSEASPNSATSRSWPSTLTCTISTPRPAAQSRAMSSAPSMARRGGRRARCAAATRRGRRRRCAGRRRGGLHAHILAHDAARRRGGPPPPALGRSRRVRPRDHPRDRPGRVRALLRHRADAAGHRPDLPDRDVPGVAGLLDGRAPTTHIRPRGGSTSPSRRPRASRSTTFWREGTEAGLPRRRRARGRGPSTARTTTAPSCSTPTATAPRPCTTARCGGAASSTTSGSASPTSPRPGASTRRSPRTPGCA